MALKNINPTQTSAWSKLQEHFLQAKDFQLNKLFQLNKNREKDFSISLEELYFDYSKNHITNETINLLTSLAKEVDLKNAIEKYFSGEKINVTENRAVLHTALRDNSDTPIYIEGKNIKPSIKTSLKKIKSLTNKVLSGKWKGYTGKTITDVVNVGIGGSDLGPSMAVEALKFYKKKLNTHFISNIDGDHVYETLKKINPETTIFIIVSKSFTTHETITNANTIRDWFLKYATVFDLAKHFIAVSSNIELAINFGIDKKNILPMWNWVGGRFSLWSAVGLSISLSIGFNNFKEMLDGAEIMDNHFRDTDFEKNIPVLLGLLSIWYLNFFSCESEAIFSYTQYLSKLPKFLQQGFMESNGKGVDRNGQTITYQTGCVIWGGVGANMQHSFMQLLHQGTKMIPSDFIGFKEPLHGNKNHHEILMANFHAQTQALAFGKTVQEAHLELKTHGKISDLSSLLPYKIFKGNKQSNTFLLDKLTPKNLGMLISMYEHKVFVQGIIWNIYSFDQFGVELGKELALKNLEKSPAN